MTPEQKQLFSQIEARYERRKATMRGEGDAAWSPIEAHADVGRLLSLVKSQEANPLHYFKADSDGRCITCGNLKLWQYHVDEEIDAATSMRSACVKKVKDWLGKAGFDHGPLVREMESLTPSGARNDKA